MKIKLPLIFKGTSDHRIVESETIKDFDYSCDLEIFNDGNNAEDDEETAFFIFLSYGQGVQKELFFDVKLNELEFLAASLQKSIEMFRRDHPELIKRKIKNRELI